MQVTTLVFENLVSNTKLVGKIVSDKNLTMTSLEVSALVAYIRFALEKLYRPLGDVRSTLMEKVMKKLDWLEYGNIDDVKKAIEKDYAPINLTAGFNVTEYNFLITYIVKIINNTLTPFILSLTQELIDENNKVLFDIVSPNTRFLTLLV